MNPEPEVLETRPTPAVVVKAAVKQLRPKQWAKNVLVFAALIFSFEFLNTESVIKALLAFASFSCMASTGYIWNDFLDREADKKHPKKRHRPIASGALPVPVALAEMVLVFAAGLGIAWYISGAFLAVVVLYFVTTVSYSMYWKHIVVLDIMFLAACYVWRAVGGAVAIAVAVSPWLLICTGFLALFLGFNKRRGELMELGSDRGTRKNLADYSPRLLEQYQALVTACSVLSYSLYTLQGAPTPWMALTIPFVLYVVFRYIFLVEQKGEGSAPDETLLTDVPILVAVLLYGVVAVSTLLLQHFHYIT